VANAGFLNLGGGSSKSAPAPSHSAPVQVIKVIHQQGGYHSAPVHQPAPHIYKVKVISEPNHGWAPAPSHGWAPAPSHGWAPAPAQVKVIKVLHQEQPVYHSAPQIVKVIHQSAPVVHAAEPQVIRVVHEKSYAPAPVYSAPIEAPSNTYLPPVEAPAPVFNPPTQVVRVPAQTYGPPAQPW